MKRLTLSLLICGFLLTTQLSGSDYDFELGTPKVESISALSFGPDGILFIGDSKSAMVFAVKTGDTSPNQNTEEINVEGIDAQLADALGADVDDVNISDLVVNPISKNIYIGVELANGSSALLKLAGENFSPVDLTEIEYSSAALNDPIGTDAEDRRGRPLRKWAISDMMYFDGSVLVSGLSNKEFGSTFRSIPFPFKESQKQSSLEIYHASHGQYETHSPIKAFTATKIDGANYMIASYTCTPLVLFPMDQLKAGEHVKGRTIAELGNRNTPLDIVTMKKDDGQYLLMANSSRALMRINYDDIKSFKESLTTPVENTAGVDFINLPYVNVLQIDAYNDENFLILQRKANGSLDLFTQTTRRL